MGVSSLFSRSCQVSVYGRVKLVFTGVSSSFSQAFQARFYWCFKLVVTGVSSSFLKACIARFTGVLSSLGNDTLGFTAVLRIRIQRIRIILPDPDP